MCWGMKVGATVTSNLLVRVFADLSEVLYKLLVSWWRTSPTTTVAANIHKHELERLSWYRAVDRKTAAVMLRDSGADGDFLLRPSSKPENLCGLSVIEGGRVYHINVRLRADGLLALGRHKPNEKCFGSVPDMVTCYSRERLLIRSGAERTSTLLSLRRGPGAQSACAS